MSKAPAPKQNFIQTLLTFAVIFLGIQLFFNARNPKSDGRTLQQIRASIEKMNGELKDVSIVHENQTYGHAIDAEEKAKKITSEQANSLRLEGLVLVADTQLKAGIRMQRESNKDHWRLDNAYNTVEQIRKNYSATALFQKHAVHLSAVQNPDLEKYYTWGSDVTPQKLYDQTVSVLSESNKNDLVIGLLPGYKIIDSLVRMTGAVPSFSYAFAAFVLALLVRLAIYPLAQKQLLWGRQMSQLQPLAKEIRERFKDDMQMQQTKTMELYKEYGINPMAGCLPAFIQMPLFLIIYQCMLHYRFEFTKGTFLWINPVTNKSTHGLVAMNLGQQDHILIIIYGISMIISTLLTPVSDPSQAKQQRMMGVGIAVFFTVMMFMGMFPVPSAFVLYWTFTNILATAQSLNVYYRMPMPPLVKVNSLGGGVLPIDPKTIISNGSVNGRATGKPATFKPKKRK